MNHTRTQHFVISTYMADYGNAHAIKIHNHGGKLLAYTQFPRGLDTTAGLAEHFQKLADDLRLVDNDPTGQEPTGS